MKRIFIILFCLISLVSKAQVYQEMPQYGYRANRMAFDSTLQIPTVCGVPTLKSVVSVNKKAAIAFDSCNNKIYKYNPKTLTWSEISGGGSQNLQQVTDLGDTTTNNITIKTQYGFSTLGGYGGDSTASLYLIDTAFSINTQALITSSIASFSYDTSIMSINSNGNIIQSQKGLKASSLIFDNTRTNSINYQYYMPYTSNSNASDTLATLKDIRSGGTTIDTANKWVNGVTLKNDSSFYVIKGTTTDSITIRGVSYASKLKTQVYNNTGVTIAKGSVVYISGRHSSNLATIALAEGNNEANSYKTFALVENDIANNASGYVIQAGKIENLNLPTATYTDGDILYLSPTVAGGFTITKPLASNHICKLGSVTRAHPTLGSIEVKIENGWQLDELSDVKIATVPADSTLLQFSRVDSLWHDVSVTNAIGTKYLKPTDTTSLSSRINTKLNASDTSSLSSRINTKLNTSDSTIYYSKYRSDTSRTNIYISLNTKVKYTDTASMLSPYFQTVNYDNDLNKAYQLLGSTIKSICLGVPSFSLLTSTTGLTNQQIKYIAIYLPKSQTITGVKWWQATTGSYTANNYNGVGLYTYSGGTLTLVASSTNDGNIWQTASNNTMGNKAFSSTYSASAGIYYIALLYSNSAQTTAPTLGVANVLANSAVASADFTNNAKLYGNILSQTSLPSTQAMSGLSSASNTVGVWLY